MPAAPALDRLVQLALGLHRVVTHANDATVGHPRRWPHLGRLSVRIGIAVVSERAIPTPNTLLTVHHVRHTRYAPYMEGVCFTV